MSKARFGQGEMAGAKMAGTVRRGMSALAFFGVLGGALSLAGCSGPGPQVSDGGCPVAAGSFTQATAYYAAPARSGLTPAAYRTALAPLGGDEAAAGRVLSDIQQDTAALDQVTAGYQALAACHTDRAAAWRMAAAGGTLVPADLGARLAAENAIFQAELAEARQVQQQAAALDSVYAEAAETLLTAHHIGLPPDRPYRAIMATAIQDRPGAGGASLATLRKGQRVLAPTMPDGAGWLAIELDDGSLGYVDITALKPVTPNASELRAPSGLAPTDPLLALSVASRQSLPQKQAVLAATLDASAANAGQAFGQPAVGIGAVATSQP
jgi:hypothetical protein